MTCDTEMYKEEFSETWTPEEIRAMEAESRLLQAQADVEVVRMANDRGWSSEYFSKMRRKAMDKAKEDAHQRAHDRHFLRQINERAESFGGNVEAIPVGTTGHSREEKTATG